ncbi:hypothetical protein CDD82_4936 [Ophiocordyceps australis]|uniref:NADPH-dependent FMN reductase-like domain-containing protein n=1 Tax=Ophiocordyceps australis TaxID=1399860 RepID=A0A2C5XJ97_9HYPO|nr:hypothetical protein CDD82_4936 [Ophiocordyceps australis]
MAMDERGDGRRDVGEVFRGGGSVMENKSTESVTAMPMSTAQEKTSDKATAKSTEKKLALVTCSTRPWRLNPFITSYVYECISPLAPSHVSINIIDLANPVLPLFDEPGIPAHAPADDGAATTGYYVHAHTREWSLTVRRYDGFIFVTPQYNWSIPAGLKNALDYLYHEWTGKVAGIVSYGSRGGGKAAGHLGQVLEGLRMKDVGRVGVRTRVDMVGEFERGGAVGEEDRRRWEEEGVREELAELGREVMDKL